MHFLPRTLSGRLVLTLVCGLLIAQILGSLLLLKDRHRIIRQASGHQLANRIVSIIGLLEQQPPQNRTTIARAISSPLFHVSLSTKPLPSDTKDALAFEFERLLIERLPHHAKLRVSLEPASNRDHRNNEPRHRPRKDRDGPRTTKRHTPPPFIPRLNRYSVQVQLHDGSWVLFQKRLPDTFESWPKKVLGYLFILLLSIILLSVFVVRQITRPLATLSDAADHLGRDINHPPLMIKGSREVRKAAEAFNTMQKRLKRYIDDRSQLLAAVSHDLKTPITRMRLRTELLDSSDIESKFNQDLDEMEHMVKATLDYMRGTESREPLVDIDMNAFLEAIRDDLSELNWDVTLSYPPLEPFRGRPLALKRCLWNLIENAVQYAESASIEVSEDKATLTLSVSDKGPGIPVDELDSIFEPFTRGEKSRNRRSGGTGLGLSIARNIARGHGGDIELNNLAEGGLHAAIKLPRQNGIS